MNQTGRANSDETERRSDHRDLERERELVERAQAGDTRAVRDLYQLCAPTVFRCAIMPLARDRALGEDLLADTFVRAIENLHKFTWQGKGILPWLIRIGKNICLDHLRRAGRITAMPDGMEQRIPDRPSTLDAADAIGLVDVGDLLRGRIDECLEEINPRYRKVIELRLVRRMPRAEAAAELDVSMGTLDVLLFRACKSFRKIYVRRHGGSPDEPEFFAP